MFGIVNNSAVLKHLKYSMQRFLIRRLQLFPCRLQGGGIHLFDSKPAKSCRFRNYDYQDAHPGFHIFSEAESAMLWEGLRLRILRPNPSGEFF